MITFCFKLGAVLAALLSILIGLAFFSSVLTRAGLYRWHAESCNGQWWVGLTPAQHYGIPWNYTFEELYNQSKNNLSGQNAIITGANSGIGYSAALSLGRLGAQVTMVCRNPAKCEAAAETLRRDEKMKGTLLTKTMDTSSLASVQNFAQEYIRENPNQSLDILLLNAGTSYVKNTGCVPATEDGIETVFQANYVGHHLLYRSLEGMLHKSKLARIVQTSSNGSFDTYSYIVATDLETLNGCSEPYMKGAASLSYGQSKLAQILWAKKLTRMLGTDSSIYANAFHPGVVDTGLWDKISDEMGAPDWYIKFIHWCRKEIMWTSDEGALTGLFLAVESERLAKENIRGKYYHPIVREMVNPFAEDEDLQDRLWKFSDELIEGWLPVVSEVAGAAVDSEEEVEVETVEEGPKVAESEEEAVKADETEETAGPEVGDPNQASS